MSHDNNPRQQLSIRSIVAMAPMLVFPILAYAALCTLSGGTSWLQVVLVTLTSEGAVWNVTASDVFIWVCLAMLFTELVKSTNSNTSTIINHGLSVLLFAAAFWLVIAHPWYFNMPFFTLMLLCLIDTVAGFIVTVVTARRDWMHPGMHH